MRPEEQFKSTKLANTVCHSFTWSRDGHSPDSLCFWQFKAVESRRLFLPFFSTERVTAGCWHVAHTCAIPGDGKKNPSSRKFRANPPWLTVMKFWSITTPARDSWRTWKRCLRQFYERVWLCENWESGQISMNEVTYLECRMRSGQSRQQLATLEARLPNKHQMMTSWGCYAFHGTYLLSNCSRPSLKDQWVSFSVWKDTQDDQRP